MWGRAKGLRGGLAGALGLCLGFVGCGGASAAGEVVVTIKPVHAIVAAVMQGAGTPHLLIQSQGSPHTYALKPSEARLLNGARVVVRVSRDLELFLERTLKSLPAGVQVVTLDAAPGLTRHKVRAGGAFEKHGHGPAKGQRHKSGRHDHGHGAHGTHDAHIWLDPRNARAMAKFLARELAKAMPEHAERFQQNAKAFDDRLAALEVDLLRLSRPLTGRAFLVFHDAYQYFEKRFGVTASGSITVSPEVMPGAKRVGEIRAKVRDLGAACVFAEPQFEPKLISVVTEGTAARSGVLDPLGAAIEPGPDLYFEVLRGMATAFKTCLSEGS
ncbi:MAG: zinc ABC transporter substrate-binding protein [Hyphomicrobiaceae bacterium]|nr:zinc ABC transporter substrate-binding protein [Hyphomicrobiaceae bacterium]